MGRKLSDHLCLFLHSSDSLNWGPKPCRPFTTWLQNTEVISLIEATLLKGVSSSNGLQCKLRQVRKAIKDWNIKTKSTTEANIKTLEKDLSECGQSSSPIRRRETEKALKSEYLIKDSILKQKARVNWFKKGDANTRYFHMRIKRRNEANHITKIWSQHTWISQPENVKELLASHFEQRFKELEKERCLRLGSLKLIRITQMEAQALEAKFEQDEISNALEPMDKDKSPGSDGFNAKYIKSMWKFLHNDFNLMLVSFHDTATLPGGLNSSFIS